MGEEVADIREVATEDEEVHVYAHRRDGRGLCAFCDHEEQSPCHRPMTEKEHADALEALRAAIWRDT